MVVKKRARAIMNHSFTCQNPSCGKVFPKPIKASNLRLKKVEVYDACPHCLAKIAAKEIPLTSEGELDLKIEDAGNDGKLALSLPIIEDKPARVRERSSKTPCTHHFGYLSQRPKKESIPEDCIVCERIVKCMLKNVTG